MEQAAREVADDTFAATQAAVAQYQCELDAAKQADDAVNQEARRGGALRGGARCLLPGDPACLGAAPPPHTRHCLAPNSPTLARHSAPLLPAIPNR